MRPTLACLLLSLAMTSASDAAPKGFNYDEAKVPDYTLPPIGDRATDLALLQEHVYGRSPQAGYALSHEILEEGPALDGSAVRRQVRLTVTGEATGRSHAFDLLIFAPVGGPSPAFVGLNFRGNQTTAPDPAIRISEAWVPDKTQGQVDNRATGESRGSRASRWCVPQVIDAGFAVATIYCGEVEPDHSDGRADGLRAIFDDPELTWGAIGGWAFALSRALDYLQGDAEIDGERVAVIGHSRLGKTSLWAGATDPRFAMVVSNNSGCGGAALSMRAFGETVARITTSFPHWFCARYSSYAGKEGTLPVDQHQLLALSAGRLLYVASASGDEWADPRGEFLAWKHAVESSGPPLEQEMPEAGGQLWLPGAGYHYRDGKHDITAWDWQRYTDFAEERME